MPYGSCRQQTAPGCARLRKRLTSAHTAGGSPVKGLTKSTASSLLQVRGQGGTLRDVACLAGRPARRPHPPQHSQDPAAGCVESVRPPPSPHKKTKEVSAAHLIKSHRPSEASTTNWWHPSSATSHVSASAQMPLPFMSASPMDLRQTTGGAWGGGHRGAGQLAARPAGGGGGPAAAAGRLASRNHTGAGWLTA